MLCCRAENPLRSSYDVVYLRIYTLLKFRTPFESVVMIYHDLLSSLCIPSRVDGISMIRALSQNLFRAGRAAIVRIV